MIGVDLLFLYSTPNFSFSWVTTMIRVDLVLFTKKSLKELG